MGASKSDAFSDEQNKMAAIAKAMGHPARIAILQYLQQVKGCICGDIVNELPLSQPTVSQHLKELKNCGLIKGHIEGTAICYCIDQTVLQQFLSFFKQLNSRSTAKKCC